MCETSLNRVELTCVFVPVLFHVLYLIRSLLHLKDIFVCLRVIIDKFIHHEGSRLHAIQDR